MLSEKESFNMMYIIIVLLASIARGKSFPQRNHGYEGQFGYDPYQESFDFPDLHVKEYKLQNDPKPTPESRYSTYVPLIDGKPIYIREMNEDLNIRDELYPNNPKSMQSKQSWGADYENSAYHKHGISHKKTYDTDDSKYRFKSAHQRKRERDRPTGYYVNRHAKPAFHKRPVIPHDYEIPVVHKNIHRPISRVRPTAYVIPEKVYNGPIVQAVSKKEKNAMPITRVKPVHPREIVDHESESDSSVEEETFNKKEKPVTFVKPVHSGEIVDHGSESDSSVEEEAFNKKEKPVTFVKPVHSGEIVDHGSESDSSIEEEAFNKKEKPVTFVKPVHSGEIVDHGSESDNSVEEEAFAKKEKHVTHKKPVLPEDIAPENDENATPVVVEVLGRKEKPVNHMKPVKYEKPVYPEIIVPEYGYDTSVVVEALGKKEKPQAHVKPVYPEEIVVPEYDGYHIPVVVEALAKKSVHHVKPDKHVKPVAYVKPVYPEEIVIPEYDDYDTPVVVEALTKKRPVTHVKPVYPEEIVVPEYDGYDTPVVVEALAKKSAHHEKPDKPVTDKPDKPVTDKPDKHVKPVTDKPDKHVKPVTDKPDKHVKPVTDKPDKHVKPVTHKPDKHVKPVTHKPDKHVKPVTHKPDKHVKPVTHKPDKHVKPVTHKPDKHVKPVTHKPDKHVKPVTHKPDKHVKPVTHKPDKHVKPVTHKPDKHVKPVTHKPDKHVKPVTDKHVKPVTHKPDKHVKPVTHKPVTHKPVKPVYPEEIVVPGYDSYEASVEVEALAKKEKPIPIANSHKKPVYPEEIVIPEYDDYDTPVVVEALAKKSAHHEKPDKPVAHKPDKHVKPVTHKPDKHVKPVTHKPVTHKPVKPVYPEEIVVPGYDSYEASVEVEALAKKEKPITHVKPVYPEEIVIPKYDEYDIPVTETVTKKEKRAINFKPVARVHSEYGYDVSQAAHSNGKPTHAESLMYVDDYGYNRPKDYGSHDNTEIDVDNIDERVIDQSSEESVDYDSHEHSDIEIPDVENIDERVIGQSFDEFVDGSGSISERSELPTPRSFLPVDPSVWSLMSNIHAQERQKFKRCFTPKNETGNCMPIQMCSVPNIASGIEELMNNVCVIDEVFIGICCPEFPVETVRVDWGQFEEDQHGETFNEDDSQEERECGKLPTSVNKTVAWPWMAPLVAVSTGKVFCGGALINEQYVLSAAHCTTRIPRNRILVRLGPLDAAHEADHFEVVEIKRHAQYNSRSMLNDIALLKLSKRVPLGDFRRLICLPDDDDDYVGETAILLRSQGFSEKTEELESLPAISNQECQNKMGVLTSDSILCTVPRKEETKCNDDSGAPLVIGKDKQFKVVGVLTWNRNDCDERFPSMFTRVSKYRKWIDNHAAL